MCSKPWFHRKSRPFLDYDKNFIYFNEGNQNLNELQSPSRNSHHRLEMAVHSLVGAGFVSMYVGKYYDLNSDRFATCFLLRHYEFIEKLTMHF